MVERMQTEDVNISPEKAFNVINDVNLPFDKKWFINAYAEWKKWNDEALRFYKENAQIVRDFLVRTENFRFGSTDEAGFNTIARLREPDLGTSSMDFLTKLPDDNCCIHAGRSLFWIITKGVGRCPWCLGTNHLYNK